MRCLQNQMLRIVQHFLFALRRTAPKNKYDREIGYITRFKNETIARLMDYGKKSSPPSWTRPRPPPRTAPSAAAPALARKIMLCRSQFIWKNNVHKSNSRRYRVIPAALVFAFPQQIVFVFFQFPALALGKFCLVQAAGVIRVVIGKTQQIVR